MTPTPPDPLVAILRAVFKQQCMVYDEAVGSIGIDDHINLAAFAAAIRGALIGGNVLVLSPVYKGDILRLRGDEHTKALVIEAPPRPFGADGVTTEADAHMSGIGPKVSKILPD